MSLKTKLLVIGAGIGQVPIIKKAKSRGCYVVAVSQKGNYPGLELVDEIFECDIYDRDRIVEFALLNKIDAVVSDQNDLMNPTVAYVAESLGLPGNTFLQVMSYCNKNIYKDNCDKLGIPSPKHIAVDSVNFDFTQFECPFPWIVKPADSQSSVGVKKINNAEELLPALEFALSKSKTHSAIVEEFFVGKEIVCEGFIENGQYHLLSFADRKYFDLKHLMIPSQTLFPSRVDSKLLSEVVKCEEKMAAFVAPSFGIVHSEYLVNEQTGEIRVIESALRGGGVYISSHLIPLATGIDINDILLNKAFGIECCVSTELEKRKSKAAGYVCFYLPEGTVESVCGVDELKRLPYVEKVCLEDIKVGELTEKMLHKGLRKGPVLVFGNDRLELEDNISKVQRILEVNVRKQDGTLAGIIWA